MKGTAEKGNAQELINRFTLKIKDKKKDKKKNPFKKSERKKKRKGKKEKNATAAAENTNSSSSSSSSSSPSINNNIIRNATINQLMRNGEVKKKGNIPPTNENIIQSNNQGHGNHSEQII